jgi:hypothetical protein
VLWWQRRASTDGRLPARDRIEAISAEGALRVELYGRCLTSASPNMLRSGGHGPPRGSRITFCVC